jgi:hypothetical protein
MEEEILRLLQQAPGTLFSNKEVGKKLDRKQYRENPNWARPLLEELLRRKMIAADANGYYFFPKPKKLGDIS